MNQATESTQRASAAADPSSRERRLPGLVCAAAGFCIAAYLAAYQLGIASSVWEPFFGDGSRRVLHSFISRMLPVPDAALGAAGYAAELLVGVIGGANRWRTHRWVVLLYGAIVLGVTLTAIGLAAVQMFVLHAGCTLCLTSALMSIAVAFFAREEVLAAWRGRPKGSSQL